MLYVSPIAATVTTIAVISFNVKKKRSVEITDEELQIEWGNGAPSSYKHK